MYVQPTVSSNIDGVGAYKVSLHFIIKPEHFSYISHDEILVKCTASIRDIYTSTTTVILRRKTQRHVMVEESGATAALSEYSLHTRIIQGVFFSLVTL